MLKPREMPKERENPREKEGKGGFGLILRISPCMFSVYPLFLPSVHYIPSDSVQITRISAYVFPISPSFPVKFTIFQQILGEFHEFRPSFPVSPSFSSKSNIFRQIHGKFHQLTEFMCMIYQFLPSLRLVHSISADSGRISSNFTNFYPCFQFCRAFSSNFIAIFHQIPCKFRLIS